MTFAWEPKFYPTRLEYQEALLPFAVPSWIKGIVLHHTYTPTQDTWRGMRSMEAMGRYYRGLGWSAGPHLYLAPDGIYAGTPLAQPGIHAGKCNASTIGLEVVGRFDDAPWPLVLAERIYALIVLLLHWAGLDETVVQGHRECLPNKSCPGSAISMPQVRRDLHDRLFDQRFVVTVPAARVRARPYTTAPILRSVEAGTSLNGHRVKGQVFQGSSDWARIKLPSSVTGYIWAGLGRFEAV